MNKKWQQNKLENRWFVTNNSQDIYEQLQVHNFNAAQEIVLFKLRNPNGLSGYLLVL